MARNEEKSHSMLNRWVQMQRDEERGVKAHGRGKTRRPNKRPHLSSLANTVADAEYWRDDLLKEIGKSVLLIQNESLEEHKVRDLNDKINKLFREKWHWNRRIRELGGPDYREWKSEGFDMSIEGPTAEHANAIRAPGGYYYFGAARNLPGVKELLAPKSSEAAKRTRHDLYQGIDADYYGFRDDEDGLLEKLEKEAEAKAREELISAWNRAAIDKYGSLDAAPVPRKRQRTIEAQAHVALPSEADIERALLARRKEELMRRFAQ